ncbi:hypothetical protein SC171_28825 [Pantoea cypripedii]|uniref:hypothetical protein n=1 Tax=Pantoea cypripedii TaxID=55209 RepID=UPI002FCAE275
MPIVHLPPFLEGYANEKSQLLLIWPIFATLHSGAPFALTMALIAIDQVLAWREKPVLSDE